MSDYIHRKNFKEFYQFYLTEHQNKTSQILHAIGSIIVLFLLPYILISQQYKLFILLPFVGYGFAWVGHFKFEKNKPLSFKQPFFSLMADYVMVFDLLRGKKI